MEMVLRFWHGLNKETGLVSHDNEGRDSKVTDWICQPVDNWWGGLCPHFLVPDVRTWDQKETQWWEYAPGLILKLTSHMP